MELKFYRTKLMLIFSGCHFNNKFYPIGSVIKSHPEKCYELQCVSKQVDSPPYFVHVVTEVQHFNSCDCKYFNLIIYIINSLLRHLITLKHAWYKKLLTFYLNFLKFINTINILIVIINKENKR